MVSREFAVPYHNGQKWLILLEKLRTSARGDGSWRVQSQCYAWDRRIAMSRRSMNLSVSALLATTSGWLGARIAESK